jgi:hypothetical protein
MKELSAPLKAELRRQKSEREESAVNGVISHGDAWDGEKFDDDIQEEESMEGLLHCPDYQFGPECKVMQAIIAKHPCSVI